MAGLSLLLRRGGLAPHPVLPDWVKFEDPEVEAILLANIPHAGEHLTLEEIAACTSVNLWFNGKKNITIFKELALFTNMVSINGQAFRSCTALKEIWIPQNVKNIYAYAFLGCSALKKFVSLPTTPPVLAADVLPGSTLSYIYVPDESVDAYKAASKWSGYASKIFPLSQYTE